MKTLVIAVLALSSLLGSAAVAAPAKKMRKSTAMAAPVKMKGGFCAACVAGKAPMKAAKANISAKK